MRIAFNRATLTIRRLQPQTGVPGVPFSGFADAFTAFCTWRQQTGAQAVVAGQVEDVVSVFARVNNSAQNRTISSADRVSLIGQDFSVISAGLPDRLGRFIELSLKRVDGE